MQTSTTVSLMDKLNQSSEVLNVIGILSLIEKMEKGNKYINR